MTKNGAVNLGVWLALVVFTAAVMTAINYGSLRTSGTMKSTEGNVIGYVPGETQSYRYQYWINGRSFQGSAKPPERVERMKLGGTITVFYDAANPGNSTLAAPRTVVVGRLALIVAASMLIPVLVMGVLHARRLLPSCKLAEDCREWLAPITQRFGGLAKRKKSGSKELPAKA